MRFPVIIFLLGTLASSCMDVVDIETADAPPLLTVDAWLNDQNVTQIIKLSKSQEYFDTSFVEGVQGASVVVEVSDGRELSFQDDGSGIYTWTPNGEILGTIGDVFSLVIEVENRQIIGNSTLRASPEIDSIVFEYREDDIRGADGIYAQFFARDLPGLGDTYWIKTFKNEQYLNKPSEINLAYDAGFDAGAEIDGLIFIPPIRESINPIPDEDEEDNAPWEVGDIIRVEIHSLNVESFDFMSRVRDEILNGTNTIFASPIANTSSNLRDISSGETVLGAFNVASISIRQVVVQ